MATTTHVGTKAGDLKDKANHYADQALDAAKDVADKAGDYARKAGDKLDGVTSSVGSGIKNMAGTVRNAVPEGGVMGTAGHAVADTLEKGGDYLESQGLSGIADDLGNLIKRNPVPATLVGIAIGYLIARATSNRS